MSQFDELLAQLTQEQEEHETLAKALPAEDGEDDDAIQAAADEEGAEADVNPEDEGEGEEDEGNGEESMTKSLTIDGEEVEVVDAEQLIKSLHGLTERVEAHEGVLAKALESTLGTIKAQGEMIKSLNAKVEKLAGQGRGRKAVLSVVDRPNPGEQPLAKSQPEQLSGQQILAKALDAQRAGKITGGDVARCEIAINSGVAVPADVLSRIQ